MIIQNLQTKTVPLFLHCQGREHLSNRWKTFAKDVCSNETFVKKLQFKNISIVTCSTDFRHSLIYQSAKTLGIDVYNIYTGNTQDVWSNDKKIKFLYEYALKCNEKYIIFLDADDVLFSSDLQFLSLENLLCELLDQYNCKILYGAGVSNWIPYSHDIDPSIPTAYRFLNAGCMVGTTLHIVTFYKYLLESGFINFIGSDFPPAYRTSEQGIIRAHWKKQQDTKVGIDYNCQLFQNIGGGVNWNFCNGMFTIFDCLQNYI